MSQGAWEARGQAKEKSQGGAVPAQAGAFRVVATLQYLGKGIPGPAEESMALGENT